MDFDSITVEAIHPEPIDLELVTAAMKRSLVLVGNSGNIDIHRIQRLIMRGCGISTHLLKILDVNSNNPLSIL
ncbi:hypothetical protein AYI69_g4487 [Smittium culicis]|uniref:Uncharacterized protein n=1 Tax=Smittium culicis TaxID=133412 RepID=A0A1R1YD70_9FUNG|nr:hypothetical protein AYI69_g4487 [Smittium culicis]